MSRKRPEGRRRPGRRPPNRYSGCHGPATPQGFTGPGFRQFYNRILPGMPGTAKKQHFNEVSDAIVLAAGVCGAVLGLICLGWLGAIMGLGAGIAAGGSFAESNRFRRR
jgi:hypothetical protein